MIWLLGVFSFVCLLTNNLVKRRHFQNVRVSLNPHGCLPKSFGPKMPPTAFPMAFYNISVLLSFGFQKLCPY